MRVHGIGERTEGAASRAVAQPSAMPGGPSRVVVDAAPVPAIGVQGSGAEVGILSEATER